MQPTARTYDRILQWVLDQPWAIRDRELAIIQNVLWLRANGLKFTAEEIAERIGAPEARAASSDQSSGGIAVVPVWGVIGHRANELRAMSSGVGTSTEVLGAQIASLVADPTVKAIVLDVNSPGGGVFGVPEVGEQIRSQRGKKPIVAVANALMASAAYWIGASASELVITPSGQIGSIGVFSMHENHSKRLASEGIDVTLVSAGKYKVEQNPFGPLSDEARAAVQERVDAYYGLFTRAVAKGRGVAIENVRNGFGEGRTVDAKEAVRLGMADQIGTLEETIARLLVDQSATSNAAEGPDVEPAAKVYRVGQFDQAETAKPSATNPDDDVPEEERCASCKGSGLKNERYMGDPEGQEECPDCNGTGRKTAAKAEKGPAKVETQADPEPSAPPPWQAEIDRRKLRLRILELG